MKIRSLELKDRTRLQSILLETQVFTDEEISVAMELIDIVLKDQNQKDYQIVCAVDGLDQPVGYICYGPVPMTQGVFDLYWIAITPGFQGKKIGSRLLDFMEEKVRRLQGRMILADTSSIASYEKTQEFYQKKGFREVGRISDYYWEGNDRITYCKKLKA
jgi:ribosomal protein S18 acetylase RimI-like enzyme